ncbi:MAG TPA: glycosyltransferase family 2 protein [Anaeromyxobacteraceae bacterium]|nr:glycosyltransferase family 2 protein [Anaeromyxobacteraceae bacterium]
MRTLVIVPAFNEAANLPRVLAALAEHAPACDVCVVDDGSSDATSDVAARLGARVLRCPVNLGIGGAVQTGYLWARDHGYDAAVQIDGDGQHDPAFIADALAPIAEGRADVVIGSRFLGGGDGFRSTRLRRAGITYLAWFLRARCGARVTDPTSGFRAAGRRAIEQFAVAYPSDYPEPEAIALATRRGLKLEEIPVRMAPRAHGRSSITAWRTVYYLVKVSLALVLLPAGDARHAPDAESPR